MPDINTMNEYRDKNHFLEIVDVDLFNTVHELYESGEIPSINHALPLNVIRSSGITTEKDFDVKVTDLSSDSKNMRFKQFSNNGIGGTVFKVDVIIRKGERWGYGVSTKADYITPGKEYASYMRKNLWLDYWFTRMRPLYVVCDAIDVPNGVYLITKNQSRKQTLDNHTVWSLEFSSFNPLVLHEWTASQSVIKATTPATSTSTTTNSSSKAKQLKDCTASNIVYSTTEKTTECNKLMQEKLYKLGFLRADQVDGWYGQVTMEAVKKFQKWYNSKGHNLLVDGDCGAVTLKALINS